MPAIDQPGMRRTNTRALRRALRDREGVVTTAQLVEDTGLSRRTVELILADLLADGWVSEVASPRATRTAGRPRRYYAFRPDRLVVAAVRLGDRDVAVRLADLRGTFVGAAERTAADESPEAVLAAALAACRAALAEGGYPDGRLAAVAVGVAGTVGTDGVIVTSPEHAEWVGCDVAAPFRDELGAPVLVENDTNLVALAELANGAATDAPTFVLLVPGHRIAAAVVVRGEIHRGVDGAAGELVRIEEIDLRGGREHPLAMLSAVTPAHSAAARELLRRAAAGEAEPVRLAEEFFTATARLVGVIGWILAPPVIVLDGAFDGVEDLVLGRLRSALDRVDAPRMEIRLATHGADAALHGGVRLALDRVAADLLDSDR